jgi:hypothetical protein
MAKETTITIDNKLVKKIVSAMFYGGCYTSAHRMSNCNTTHNALNEFVCILESKGWKYTMNGNILAPKK